MNHSSFDSTRLDIVRVSCACAKDFAQRSEFRENFKNQILRKTERIIKYHKFHYFLSMKLVLIDSYNGGIGKKKKRRLTRKLGVQPKKSWPFYPSRLEFGANNPCTIMYLLPPILPPIVSTFASKYRYIYILGVF